METERERERDEVALHLTLQKYLLTKAQPLPIDVEYSVQDTLESIRPNIKMYSNISDVEDAIAEISPSLKGAFCKRHVSSVLPTKITASQNKVALIYHTVCAARTIFSGSYFCGDNDENFANHNVPQCLDVKSFC